MPVWSKTVPFSGSLALGKRANRHIRAGEYELTGAMSPSAILDKLVRGEIKVYQVTLPEDITVNEVAKRLSAFKLINEKEFVTLATDRSFLASLDIEADSIEGYLYPDTYRFDRSMTTRGDHPDPRRAVLEGGHAGDAEARGGDRPDPQPSG